MSLITPISCPHQAFVDTLVPAGPGMVAHPVQDTVLCHPTGIPFIASENNAAGQHLYGWAYQERAYEAPVTYVILRFAQVAMDDTSGGIKFVCSTAPNARIVLDRIPIPRTAWLQASAEGRIALLQAQVRAVSAPRSQQLRVMILRLAQHRWNQLVLDGVPNLPSEVCLTEDGRIQWRNDTRQRTEKVMTRTLLSRRRTAATPDIGAMVRDLYQVCPSLQFPLFRFSNASLTPAVILSRHGFLAERQEILADFLQLGIDLANHI